MPCATLGSAPPVTSGTRPVLNIGVGDAGADHDSIRLLLDLPKFFDAGDIDQKIGLDQTHVEHGPEGLTAGYDLDGTSVLGEQRQRAPPRLSGGHSRN